MDAKIRRIRQFRADLIEDDNQGVIAIHEQIVSENLLDVDGNETERLTYDQEGNVEERVITEYASSKPVKIIMEINDMVVEQTGYQYDETGKLVKEQIIYQEGEPDEAIYTYEGERLVARQVFDEDGVEGEKMFRKYEDDRLMREEFYNSEGALERSKTYIYNDRNQLEETVELRINDDGQMRIVNVLDEAGNVILEKRYDTRGNLVMRSRSEVNEQGLPESIEEENAYGKTITLLAYDDKGRNIRLQEVTETGLVLNHIERTFNDQGLLLTLTNKTEPTALRAGSYYRIRNEYEFY
ncbi:MAG: hypothetical protein RBS33_07120 [Lentimicrobium sp.]|jgi:hypothetical protein|nr:hypothetical protein [Lentimicrobiaceae bacterium]MDY0025738.1 hypothetical protein [Lentimicrobium sp.]